MIANPSRLLLTAALSIGLAASLGACGKKGLPRPPEGQESQYTYPHPYPAPQTVTPDGEEAEGAGTSPFSIFTGNDSRTKTTTY